MWLLLKGTLALDCQFGRHDCGDEQSVEVAKEFDVVLGLPR